MSQVAQQPKRLPYLILDVFTLPPSRAFTGNPLAVVYDSEGLSTAQLQTLAAEFNLSETVFPVVPNDEEKKAGVSYNTRIFTIAEEFPFAGHPSLGSCFSMIHRGVIPSDATQALQKCPYGLVEMAITPPTTSNPTTRIALSSPIAYVSEKDENSLSEEFKTAIQQDFQIASSESLSVHTASAGLPFVYLQVGNEEAVMNCRPSMSGCQIVDSQVALNSRVEGEKRPFGLVVFWVGDKLQDGSIKVHQRVFTEEIAEDPATGSASIALGLVLHALDHCEKDTTTVFSISQGAEMGHPSAIRTEVVTDSEGKAVKLWVEGEVVLIAEGTIRIPDV